MADRTPPEFSITIPPEPPDFSVVVGGQDGTGRAWMRDDPTGHTGPGWWHPAGPYTDDHLQNTVTPLRWSVLLAQYQHVKVLRWGREWQPCPSP